MNIYNFIRCNPSLLKRGRFSRGQKFYGPTGAVLTTPLTVLCTTSGKPSPLLYLQAITFTYLRKWIEFAPKCAVLEIELDGTDLISVYDDEVSRMGGTTIIRSTVSRATNSTFQRQDSGMYNANYFDLRSDVEGGVYNIKTLNLTFPLVTDNPLQDEALQHVALVIKQCTKMHINSKNKVVALAAYLECIKILDAIYRTCTVQDIKQEILYSVSQILNNLKHDKVKFILIPAALSIMMKYSPDYQLAPEQNEVLVYLYVDVIARNYETSAIMYEVMMFSLEFAKRLTKLFALYFPNIFKIIAYRPTTFAREISMLLPHFYSPGVLVELYRTIVELPVLSALIQTNVRTSPATDWLRRLRTNKTSPADITRLFPELKDHVTHSKVLAASQLAPVLLKLFLKRVTQSGDCSQIFWVCFMGMYKLVKIGEFQIQTSEIIIDFLNQTCHSAPSDVISEHLDRIISFLRNIEQYLDHVTSSRLVNVLTPAVCKADLSVETISQLHKITEQQLYIVSALSRVDLINSLLLLLVVVSVKEPSLNEQTLVCISNIKKKVCARATKHTEARSLVQLVDTLSTLLRHGGGSLVEVYKTTEFLCEKSTAAMLNVLQLIENVVKL